MEPQIVDLPKILDARGNLTFIQKADYLPFKIERVFWTYDVPGGEIRGGHAYKQQQELIIALSGSFDVVIFDGETTKKFSLNRSYFGLYVPNGSWRHLENFATNTCVLTLASTAYNADDYIREKEDYLKWKKL